MTNKIQNSQGDFEKWAKTRFESWAFEKILADDEPECAGEYVSAGLESCWQTWQASRSALEPMLAELQKEIAHQKANWHEMHRDCVKAEQALREARDINHDLASTRFAKWKQLRAENEKLRELLRRSPAMREPENCMCSSKATCLAHKWIGEVEQALSPSPTPAQARIRANEFFQSPRWNSAELKNFTKLASATQPEPTPALIDAVSAHSATEFLCKHGSFPNPCLICHGQHADFATTDPNESPKPSPDSPTPRQYTNREGDRCSQACGEDRHGECTETYETCNCTCRVGHNTPHRYSNIRAAATTGKGEQG
jgi:hypothetical protein